MRARVSADGDGPGATVRAPRHRRQRARRGRWFAIPDVVERALWPDRAAHTGEAIDFSGARGQAVAVIGAAPRRGTMPQRRWSRARRRWTCMRGGRTCRRSTRVAAPPIPAIFEGWAALTATERWDMLVWLHDLQAPPPHETVLRTIAHPGFHHPFRPVRCERRRRPTAWCCGSARTGAGERRTSSSSARVRDRPRCATGTRRLRPAPRPRGGTSTRRRRSCARRASAGSPISAMRSR